MKKRRGMKSKPNRPTEKSSDEISTGSKFNFNILLFGFILVGVLYHWVGLNYSIITGLESQHWPVSAGTVTDVRIEKHTENRTNARGGSTTTSTYYEAIVEYRYEINGALYTNNRVTAGGGWFCDDYEKAKEKTDSVTGLTSVRVFYDPSDPSRSVLDRGVPDREWSGLIVTIPLIGVAAGMALYNLAGRRMPDEKLRRRYGIMVGLTTAVLAGLVQCLISAVWM